MSAFGLTIKRRAGGVVVRLHGDVDDAAIECAKRVLSDLVEDQGNLAVSVEFADDVEEERLHAAQRDLERGAPAVHVGAWRAAC